MSFSEPHQVASHGAKRGRKPKGTPRTAATDSCRQHLTTFDWIRVFKWMDVQSPPLYPLLQSSLLKVSNF